MDENTNQVVETEEKKHKAEENSDSGAMTHKPISPVKALSGLLAILTFLLSLPIIASMIWLIYMQAYDCEKILQLPRLQTGISIGLILVFFISNAAIFFRSRSPVLGLLIVIVPLIFMFIIGLALVGAYNMQSRHIPASPRWLKFRVHENWSNIKACIYDSRVCEELASRTVTLKVYDFNMKKFSSVESGCCKPPKICGMVYVNATFWDKEGESATDGEGNLKDTDCDSWQNSGDILCYNCNSCKEGFLGTLRSKWWKLGIFLVVMSLFLILSHLLLFLTTMWEHFKG